MRKLILNLLTFLLLSILGNGVVLSQTDEKINAKLDSLIKLSQIQLTLLDPLKSEEYKAKQAQYNICESEKVSLNEDIQGLNQKLNKSKTDNAQLMSVMTQVRTDAKIRLAIVEWLKLQNLELDASQKLSFVFSEKLDEIDKAFTMAPDTNVINTLHKNLKYLQLNKSNLKSRSSLLSDVDLYIFRISEYYKCLQEYELLCKQIIPGEIVKSTVTDIMSIYKMDLSYFPFLKGAYFYSIDYPDSMKFRDDFLWFVLNDVQIPSK